MRQHGKTTDNEMTAPAGGQGNGRGKYQVFFIGVNEAKFDKDLAELIKYKIS